MKRIEGPKTHIPYYMFENLKKTGFVKNAFTTKLYRKNGKDNFFFQPLLRKDSDPEEVSCCISMLASQFEADIDMMVPSAQKHTANIHKVTLSDLGPASMRIPFEYIDGLITDIPGVMLMTYGADCPSVYLADPVNKAIGLCHSGRKGTQQHIAAVMLRGMTDAFGTRPEDVLAAISPGICVDCYEVGNDVAEDFIKDYLSPEGIIAISDCNVRDDIMPFIDGKYHIDLFRSISCSLLAAGVPYANIEVSDLCTKCRSDIFYSFRAEGKISSENCALLMII